MIRPVRSCQCARCQLDAPHPDREYHRQMDLLLSRLDEQRRRWYLAVESHASGTAPIGCCSRLLAWMRRRSVAAVRNWRLGWRTNRRIGCAARAEQRLSVHHW